MTKINTIGVIAAMQIEIDALKERLGNSETITISGIDYVCGSLHGKKVIAAKCGIGKVFAAVCAQTMITRFSPDCIINTGVAGALNPALHITDIVIGEKTVQHDMDTSAIGDPVGLVSGINVIFFESDKFIAVKKSLDEMHQLGFLCSLDDFGVGFSNLARVFDLPFEVIKLDRSLMLKIEKNEKAYNILKSLVATLHNAGFKVVAEGLETENQVKKAMEIEVDKIQGFYYARPMCERDLLQFLEEHK